MDRALLLLLCGAGSMRPPAFLPHRRERHFRRKASVEAWTLGLIAQQHHRQCHRSSAAAPA
jgi:hypothetical protein